MTAEQDGLDPAQVQEQHAFGRRHWCSGHWYDPSRQPCLPYRLAALALELQGKVAGLEHDLGSALSVIAECYYEDIDPMFDGDQRDCFPNRAALADQPEP